MYLQAVDSNFFTDYDTYLFKEGSHFRLYNKLGAHVVKDAKGVTKGTYFLVWAPNAKKVSVIGDFNRWNPDAHLLNARKDESGIWEGFMPEVGRGTLYKYHIVSRFKNYQVEKGDPFGFCWEISPKTASVVWDFGDYKWKDDAWLKERHKHNALTAPLSIYEVHLGSWMKVPEENGRFLTYREIAPKLVDYVKKMSFTHIEFLPILEHPFYGSWGYQVLGYFAPTSRYGSPQDFMYLVDYLHQNEIGVILDWVPSHFPSDEHGLIYFDGTHLYEHADPRKGFHPDWKSYIFNYGRCEVKNFLLSSAIFWLDKYHIDALRVDAVASMLYLDYSRKEGEWIPNEHGGRENLEAIDFLRKFNEAVYKEFPDIQTIAEESTSWPQVSRPAYAGGLGFGMKWNMGWMHDTLSYFVRDSVHRKYHHNELTFSLWYAFYENFILCLSHDEVVHGKGALLEKMPGDDWQKFANLRLLYGYMYAHPGKKLLFMGQEFGQRSEWNHDRSLDWHLLQYAPHISLQRWVHDLNDLYKHEASLYELDFEQAGFEWIDSGDWENSIVSFVRRGKFTDDIILVVCNLTPVTRHNYRIGVPMPGLWREILNSDAQEYGGTGQGNLGGVQAEQIPFQGRLHSVSLTLPPLSAIFLKGEK